MAAVEKENAQRPTGKSIGSGFKFGGASRDDMVNSVWESGGEIDD